MKLCTKCKEAKSLDEFNRNKNAKDGRQSNCRNCQSAYGSKWRAAHSEHSRAASAEYRRNNAENIAEWRRSNRERFAEYRSAYDAANPHVGWESGVRYRAEKYGTNPKVDHFTKEDVIAKYGDQCWHCSGRAFESLDHYPVPIVRGGDHVLENVRPSCMDCQQYSWRETA